MSKSATLICQRIRGSPYPQQTDFCSRQAKMNVCRVGRDSGKS